MTASTKAQSGPGRPSVFTDAIADEIVARLSKGEPLASICRSEGMPCVQTVANWRKADEAFSVRIAGARDEGFDAIASDCLDIADDGRNDYVTKTNPDGSTYEAFDSEHVQRSKLRIETRLKLLAKWDPKRYGEKVQMDHGGHIGITISSDDNAL